MDIVKPLISIVIPELNEAECLPKLYSELCRVCDPLPYQFEFLIVDDGSTDRSVEILAELHRRDPRVRYLAFSRNFGHQAALSAGLAYSSGDAVIMMDGDLQHPPAMIPQFLDCWKAGYDIVNTIRMDTQGVNPLKRFLSNTFYRVFNRVTRVHIVHGGADFRLMSRAAVDELNALPERHRFLRGLVSWMGYRQTQLHYTAPRRFAGQAKLSFGKSLHLAMDGLLSFSVFPLRLIAILGWCGMAASLGFGFLAVLLYLLMGISMPVGATLLAGMTFLASLQLAATGMLGEYLGRVLDQVRGRPMYIVRESQGVANIVRFPTRVDDAEKRQAS